MDEFLEQMLFASPWADGAGMGNAGYDAMPMVPMAGMPVDSIAALQGLAKASSNHLARAMEDQESLKDSNGGCRGVGDQSHNLQTLPAMAPAWMASTSGAMRSDPFSSPGERACINKTRRDDEAMVLQNAHQGQGKTSGDHTHLGKSPAKPRVRARRGQATDPHSIAERNRRERIAERMKALQELVPDSNKTDKTSMLDEIIGYVKFLQMQVKCLSMCRLGGAGAAAPLLADLPVEGAASFIAANLVQANGTPGPSQDGVASSERQVATLMDEDMSAAMQYLQSKGLCLMPISLATAISSTGARMQQPPQPKGSSDPGGNEKTSMDSTDTKADSSNVPGVPLGNDGSGMVANDAHMIPTTKKANGTACSVKGGMK